MIKKRLLKEVPSARKYVWYQVGLQWVSLLANAGILFLAAEQIQRAGQGVLTHGDLGYGFGGMLVLIGLKMLCASRVQYYSHLASCTVKNQLRYAIYDKLLHLKQNYQAYVSTSELVQLSVEGIDQLEIYFGRYLPQFFYSMLAPITLFVMLVWIEWKSALVLLIFVPLIPISIIAVQKFAKRLLSRYWVAYTGLGDSFLDNLQGLTTLKIYQADEWKHHEMNKEAEQFRRITMKVLTMQLNSVSVMDMIAYGGAALGCITAAFAYINGSLSLAGVLLIILLSSEFFLPLRLLGSYFHIAMNGMTASDKIFRILDIQEDKASTDSLMDSLFPIHVENLQYGYLKDQDVLKKIHLDIPKGTFIGVCGVSGSGKSTLAKVLCGMRKDYRGHITCGKQERSKIEDSSFWKSACYVGHQGFIAKGTVKENLLMGNEYANDDAMWRALKQVRLDAFIQSQGGLDMKLEEGGANFSGGQRQRLVLARALLKDCVFYIFDEATSNIDSESEQAILDVIQELRSKKTIFMITHRLRAMTECDHIYLLDNGALQESGSHQALMKKRGKYYELYSAQQELEMIRGGERYA